MGHYHTSDIARAVGVHPNTVRLYERWGFLPPIPRAPNGYRQYSPLHLEQMRLARMAMRITWLGGAIRKVAYAMLYRSAAGQLTSALEQARALQQMIEVEQTHAHAAADVLEQWVKGRPVAEALREEARQPLSIGEVAQLLDVTVDMLRNWERNGLLSVPRNPTNGYRQYGPPEINRLLIIRTLRKARFSMMAILRMMLALDEGLGDDPRQVLDTPRPGEEVYAATDHWITTLREMVVVAEEIVTQLHLMIHEFG